MGKKKKIRLSEIPKKIAIYLCGDIDKSLCGFDGKLVAHRCKECLFCKTEIDRAALKDSAKIYYRKTKIRPS